MRIDVHAHYFNNEYIDLLAGFGQTEMFLEPARRMLQPRAADLEERFGMMDRAKVDLQVLSVSGVTPYFADERSAVAGARHANDLYAQLVRENPGRFAAFAVLPLPHMDASLREYTRAVDELGMLGVTFTTSVLGKSLADETFAPMYEEMNRRHEVLFVHPAGLACDSPTIVRDNLTWPLGAPFEDTLCALQLLQSGFVRRYPNIKTILPHLGGTLPFLIQRLDHMAQRFMPGKGVPREESRKYWYDTVNGYIPALQMSVETFGADRIVFGTDYPFWKGDAHQLCVDFITQAGLSAAQTNAIFSGTVQALFDGRKK